MSNIFKKFLIDIVNILITDMSYHYSEHPHLDLSWWVFWSKARYLSVSTLAGLTPPGTLLTVWPGARPGREPSQLLMQRLWRPCAGR